MTRHPEVTFDEALARCHAKMEAAEDLGTGGEPFFRIWAEHHRSYVDAKERLRDHVWKKGEWVELRRGAGAQWARVEDVSMMSGEILLKVVATGAWRKHARIVPRWKHTAWHRMDNARLTRVAEKPPFSLEGLAP